MLGKGKADQLGRIELRRRRRLDSAKHPACRTDLSKLPPPERNERVSAHKDYTDDMREVVTSTPNFCFPGAGSDPQHGRRFERKYPMIAHTGCVVNSFDKSQARRFQRKTSGRVFKCQLRMPAECNDGCAMFQKYPPCWLRSSRFRVPLWGRRARTTDPALHAKYRQ